MYVKKPDVDRLKCSSPSPGHTTYNEWNGSKQARSCTLIVLFSIHRSPDFQSPIHLLFQSPHCEQLLSRAQCGAVPGGGTPIHKLYGDVPPFRVWFFGRRLISRVSNSKISEDFL